MTPGAWQTVEDLFHETLAIEPSRRGEFLASRCSGDTGLRTAVERLLSGHESAEVHFVTPPETSVPQRMPDRIGRYRTLRLIASGGMGAVYEAEQDHPRRTVAVKLLRFGSASLLRRFERESEILALLRHPGIAQVYESGTFDDGAGPIPYFAMEFVPWARPITAFAKSLRTCERLNLFLDACDAVHHAHQRGVIHRDLKPGNILVDPAGRLKIIDFGIARVADSAESMHTRTGQLIGTVAYMSPEQCDGHPSDVDTRSDGYSLGVVLFELLTGRTPFDVGEQHLIQATRAIRESPPIRPSTLDRTLRGDLETIILTAIDRDPARRYQSVADLAADIRRYLADKPITARPATLTYQLRKFARRHRALAAGAAIAITGVVAGAVGITWQAARLAQQRDAARDQADTAARIAECLQTAIASFNPHGSAAVAPSAAVHASAQSIAQRLRDKPLAQAEFYYGLATAYFNMGLYDRARPLLESAAAILSSAHPGDPQRAVLVTALLADSCRLSGDRTEAERLYRVVITDTRAEPTLRGSCGRSLTGLLLARGERAQAATIGAAAIADADAGGDTYSRVETRVIVSRALPPDAARARLDEAALLAGDDPNLLSRTLVELGAVETAQGRVQAAASAFDSVTRMWFEHPPAASVAAAHTCRDVGVMFASVHRHEDADRFFQQALRRYTDLYGTRHIDVASVDTALAQLRLCEQRPDQAAAYYRQAVIILRDAVGIEHPDVGACLFHLARIAVASGDTTSLQSLRIEAQELDRVAATLPETHPHRSGVLLLRGLIDTALGDPQTAEPLLRECVRLRTAQLGANNKITAYAQTVLGMCLTRLGQLDEARAILEDFVPRVQAAYPIGSFMAADAQARLDELNAADSQAHQ